MRSGCSAPRGELQNVRNRRACMDATRGERDACGVHLQQRQSRLLPLDRGPEPVGRHEWHAAAVSCPSAAAGDTVTARDLERHADELTGPDRRHAIADLDHLGNALVPDGERRGKGGCAGDDQAVEVAGGDRDRTHESCVATSLTSQSISWSVTALARSPPAGSRGRPRRHCRPSTNCSGTKRAWFARSPSEDFSGSAPSSMRSASILARVRRCIDSGLIHGDDIDIAHALIALVQGLAAAPPSC